MKAVHRKEHNRRMLVRMLGAQAAEFESARLEYKLPGLNQQVWNTS
jgi:hypothetical protein